MRSDTAHGARSFWISIFLLFLMLMAAGAYFFLPALAPEFVIRHSPFAAQRIATAVDHSDKKFLNQMLELEWSIYRPYALALLFHHNPNIRMSCAHHAVQHEDMDDLVPLFVNAFVAFGDKGFMRYISINKEDQYPLLMQSIERGELPFAAFTDAYETMSQDASLKEYARIKKITMAEFAQLKEQRGRNQLLFDALDEQKNPVRKIIYEYLIQKFSARAQTDAFIAQIIHECERAGMRSYERKHLMNLLCSNYGDALQQYLVENLNAPLWDFYIQELAAPRRWSFMRKHAARCMLAMEKKHQNQSRSFVDHLHLSQAWLKRFAQLAPRTLQTRSIDQPYLQFLRTVYQQSSREQRKQLVSGMSFYLHRDFILDLSDEFGDVNIYAANASFFSGMNEEIDSEADRALAQRVMTCVWADITRKNLDADRVLGALDALRVATLFGDELKLSNEQASLLLERYIEFSNHKKIQEEIEVIFVEAVYDQNAVIAHIIERIVLLKSDYRNIAQLGALLDLIYQNQELH